MRWICTSSSCPALRREPCPSAGEELLQDPSERLCFHVVRLTFEGAPLAFGSRSVSACAALRSHAGLAPPSMTSVGTETEAHRFLESGLPGILSPRGSPAY